MVTRAERGPLEPLRHRQFVTCWLGAFVSHTAAWMQTLTVPFVVFQITHSPAWLGVTSFAGSAGPVFPLADGTGLFGPPDGTTLANGGALGGVFTFPGLVMPPAPVGAAARLQAVYLDPAAPGGFRLTWTRRVDL